MEIAYKQEGGLVSTIAKDAVLYERPIGFGVASEDEVIPLAGMQKMSLAVCSSLTPCYTWICVKGG